MWPDRVSNSGPLIYESGAQPTALRGPALALWHVGIVFLFHLVYVARYGKCAHSYLVHSLILFTLQYSHVLPRSAFSVYLTDRTSLCPDVSLELETCRRGLRCSIVVQI